MSPRFLRLIVLAPLMLACSIIQYENSDNSTPQKASQHLVYPLPSIIEGQFRKFPDIHYFPIFIKQAGYYSFAVTSVKGVDTRLTLFNQKLQALVVADDYYKNFGEKILSFFLKPGFYYVAVEAKPLQQPYNDNRDTLFTLIMEPFYDIIPVKEFTISQNYRTYKSIQLVKPSVPVFGFFQPTDDMSIQTHLDMVLIHLLSTYSRNIFTPYKLDLYTFDTSVHTTALKLSLSGVIDSKSSVLVLKWSDFQKYLQHQRAMPKNMMLFDKTGYDEALSANITVEKNTRYLIAIIGMNRLSYKTFAEAQHNFYQLEISPSDDKKSTLPHLKTIK